MYLYTYIYIYRYIFTCYPLGHRLERSMRTDEHVHRRVGSPGTIHNTCLYVQTGRSRFRSIRFGFGLSENTSVRFGLEDYIFQVDAVRPAFSRRGSRRVVARSGSVRFVSAFRFRPIPKLGGSFRFGRFGSVSYSFFDVCMLRA